MGFAVVCAQFARNGLQEGKKTCRDVLRADDEYPVAWVVLHTVKALINQWGPMSDLAHSEVE